MTNFNELADHYEDHALKVFERQQDFWSDDEDMLDMFEGDYNDHLTVAHFVRQGLLDKARHYLWRMDTAAREECPDRVYDVLYPDHV
ncbi:MAG: hypothetical protein VW443_04705 [Pseudomonadales bacterium]